MNYFSSRSPMAQQNRPFLGQPPSSAWGGPNQVLVLYLLQFSSVSMLCNCVSSPSPQSSPMAAQSLTFNGHTPSIAWGGSNQVTGLLLLSVLLTVFCVCVVTFVFFFRRLPRWLRSNRRLRVSHHSLVLVDLVR